MSITPDLAELLRKHQATQAKDVQKLLGHDSSPDWFVFADPDSPTIPVRPGTFAMRLQAHLKASRFAEVTPHDLRHAHGSALLDAGWSIARAAARLRDRQETLVRIYSHQVLREQGSDDGLADALGVAKRVVIQHPHLVK